MNRHITDKQIYVVVDIEADGPMPGMFSMLSLAAVATTPDAEVAQFYRKILPLEEAGQDSDTMKWWETQPEAWKEVNTNAQKPETVIADFVDWLSQLKGQAIFVSNPIALDYSFVGWYLTRFASKNPFCDENGAMQTLDLRSFISGKFGLSFDVSTRTELPAILTRTMPPHTHKAIDDAVGYANLLRRALELESL